MMLLALPGGEPLAASLASLMHCDWSSLMLHRFPDGEQFVRIDVPVAHRRVVLVGSLDQPDTKTLPLLFAADAARELGAREVGLLAPYLAYMRQDDRFHAGEALTSATYARLLSASLDFLVTVDPHLHRWRSLDDIYTIRTRVVAAAPAIAKWILSNIESPIVVGPDSESAQWVAEVARLAGAPHMVLSKVRTGDNEVSIAMPEGIDALGRTPVLVDDIVSSGATVFEVGKCLRAAGLPPPVCIAVHALFPVALSARFVEAGFRQVITCDTVPHPSNAIRLALQLAQALHCITSS